jgi:hypothetical protein
MRESALRRCETCRAALRRFPHHRLQSDQISYPRAKAGPLHPSLTRPSRARRPGYRAVLERGSVGPHVLGPWRRVYNWSSKKLIGFHHLQGKATWRCACSSDNESSVVWHFWRIRSGKAAVQREYFVLVVHIGPSHSLPPCSLEHSQILLEANRSAYAENALLRQQLAFFRA